MGPFPSNDRVMRHRTVTTMSLDRLAQGPGSDPRVVRRIVPAAVEGELDWAFAPPAANLAGLGRWRAAGDRLGSDTLLALQRVVGNARVGRLIEARRPAPIQRDGEPAAPAPAVTASGATSSTLAQTAAAASSALSAADLTRFRQLLAASDHEGAVGLIYQVMVRRGEVDPRVMATVAVTDSVRNPDCQSPGPIQMRPGVNGANTISCGCLDQGGQRVPNPRIRINVDTFLTLAVSTTHQGSFHVYLADLLHSTLLHEYRHVRQMAEGCRGGGTGSGVCTDCNDPEEMDAYLSEIESGHNPDVYRLAWVRVHVNWDWLSPRQQQVFTTRRDAARRKIDRAFPRLDWDADPRMATYRTQCESLNRSAGGTTTGQCDSPLAPR